MKNKTNGFLFFFFFFLCPWHRFVDFNSTIPPLWILTVIGKQWNSFCFLFLLKKKKLRRQIWIPFVFFKSPIELSFKSRFKTHQKMSKTFETGHFFVFQCWLAAAGPMCPAHPPATTIRTPCLYFFLFWSARHNSIDSRLFSFCRFLSMFLYFFFRSFCSSTPFLFL